MSTVQIGDRKFVKYISETQIREAVDKVAAQVNQEYRNDVPIILVVLNGSIIFGADLMKKLEFPCRLSCVKLSSYEGVKTTSTVKNLIGLSESLEGQRVLVVEDIIDTGTTYAHLLPMLMQAGAKDVKIATLTFKPDSYKKPYPIDFVGMEIPNKFIVGCGMDYNGFGRNLRDIYQVVEE